MNITLQTLKQHVSDKRAYMIMDVLKNNLVSVNTTAIPGEVIYEFDLVDAYVTFRALAIKAEKSGKLKLFDNYWSYLELFNKMKENK